MFDTHADQPKNPYLAVEYEAARKLRSDGASMKAIARELGVALSTVSLWTRDIVLSPEQQAANRKRAGELRGKKWSERHRSARREWQAQGRARARKRDAQHMAGCMLYWSDGAMSRNTVRFSNSDVAMVVAFRRFLTACYGITEERFTISLNVYLGNDRTIEEIEAHWLAALELPRTALRKHMVNHFPTSSSGLKRNKLPYGVCNLTVTRSTELVQHIFGAIQEYGEFEEPRWLDGLY